MIDYETYKSGLNEDILVLELTGRLDDHTAEFLVDCLAGQINEGCTKIVIDCHHLEYISSTGMGALVRINSRLKPDGGEVSLSRVKGMIADVLRIVHLDRLFHIYPTVEEACEALDK